MKTFVYTATDVQGNTVKNARMVAEDVNDFLEKIHEKGLFCSSYKEASDKGAKTLHKFTTGELAYNCRQLSAMLTSGLTLVRALDILYKEQEKDNTKQLFREVYEEVQKGSSFSDALKMQQGAFPSFMVSMIQAGESSGSLDVIIRRLEEYYDKQNKLNNKIRGALMYPIILAVLCVAIVIALFTFIMPTFKDLLTEKDMSYRKYLYELMASRSLKITPFLELGNVDMIRNLVARGIGISYLPKYRLRNFGISYRRRFLSYTYSDRYCSNSSMDISTFLGFVPSSSPTTPASASWSIIRAARLNPTLNHLWIIPMDALSFSMINLPDFSNSSSRSLSFPESGREALSTAACTCLVCSAIFSSVRLPKPF